MRRRERPDHLSSSFTDLMTSLVVIFILLFLAFVLLRSPNRQQGTKRASAERKLQSHKREAPAQTEDRGDRT